MAEQRRKTKAARKRKRRSWLVRLRANFLTGLVLVAPVILTIYLIWTLITFVDSKIVPWVPNVYNPSTYLDVEIPGFGVVVFIVLTTVVLERFIG